MKVVRLSLLTAVLAVALAAPAAAQAPPQVERAAAAIVVDVRDGAVMFQKRPDEDRQIASATKLMTALLALERTEPDEVLTAPAYNPLPAESRINLRRGERMRADDLLEALLLESANDAAVTFAEGISGSRSAFVSLMNRRARELGLSRTSYANPIGLDDPGNHSTARDLARLSARLMRRPEFARVVDEPEAVLESGSRRRVIDNRNSLVASHPFVDGIKTGHTIGAGYVLVGAARESSGAGVISVVLGEPSEAAREADTLALLRWGLGRFKAVRPLDTRRAVARPEVKHRDDRAVLVPRRSVSLTVRKGQRVSRRVNAPDELDGPIPAGTKVGTVTVVRDGRPVRRVDLLTASDVPGAGTLRVLLSVLGVPLTLLLTVGILGSIALAALQLRRRHVRR